MFKVLKISGIQKIFTLWITVIWRGELKTIGITQGSILGPILFPWYTKSMGFVMAFPTPDVEMTDNKFIFFTFWNPVCSLNICATDRHLPFERGQHPTYTLHLHPTCPFWTIQSCSSFQGRHLPSTTVLPATLGQWTWVWHWMTSWPFAANIATTTVSCRFLLYNTMRIIMFLT